MNYRELIKLQKPPELIKIRTVTISEINNKSEHIHGDESVRIIGYCDIVTKKIFSHFANIQSCQILK